MDSGLSLEDRERAKYTRMYYAGGRPYNGPGANLVPGAMEHFQSIGIGKEDTIVDYGCGTGDACVRFQDNGLRVYGIDLVDSLSPEYRHYVPFGMAPLWNLPDNSPVTDWSFSSHVLEHIVPEKVGESLKNIADHTVKGSFHQISHLPDIMGTKENPLHMTVKPWEWWVGEINKYFLIEWFKNYPAVNSGGFKETSCLLIPRAHKRKTAIPLSIPSKSSESVVIVGHGPSGMKSRLGDRIDSHNHVVRFAWRRDQPAAHYGRKVDWIVASLRNHGDIINEGTVPNNGSWVFGRPGQMTYEVMRELALRLKKYNPGFGREVHPWQHRFSELGANGYIDPRQGGPGLIPSFSQGTGAIIMACVRLRPRRINLVGFDNVWAGNQDNYNDWNAIRRGEAPRRSGHDMQVERILIDELMKHYNVEIRPL